MASRALGCLLGKSAPPPAVVISSSLRSMHQGGVRKGNGLSSKRAFSWTFFFPAAQQQHIQCFITTTSAASFQPQAELKKPPAGAVAAGAPLQMQEPKNATMVGSNVPSFQQAIHRLQVAEFPPLMYWFFLSLDLQACYTCFLSCFFKHCGWNLQVTADCSLWIFQAFLHMFFFLSFFFKQFLLKLADISADCNIWIFKFVLWIGLLIQKKTLVMKQDYWASIGCAVMQSSNTEVTTTMPAAEDCS